MNILYLDTSKFKIMKQFVLLAILELENCNITRVVIIRIYVVFWIILFVVIS